MAIHQVFHDQCISLVLFTQHVPYIIFSNQKTVLIYSFSLTTLAFVGQSAGTKLKLVVVVERKRENELQQLIISEQKPLSPLQCTE
jgi:hypothetical protein